MNWNDVNTFLAMGGYGLYVWGSVLMTVLLLATEALSLRMRRVNFLRRVARRLRLARKEGK